MPRRRVNHCEVSAIKGPNVADAPTPMKMCRSANEIRLGANPAAMYPTLSASSPHMTGAMMPSRSDSRPIATPPNAKPIMASVNGSDASRPRDAELGLHRGQHHRHRPHADASDGAEHDGGRKPPPGEGRFDPGVNSPGLEHLYLGVFLRLFAVSCSAGGRTDIVCQARPTSVPALLAKGTQPTQQQSRRKRSPARMAGALAAKVARDLSECGSPVIGSSRAPV